MGGGNFSYFHGFLLFFPRKNPIYSVFLGLSSRFIGRVRGCSSRELLFDIAGGGGLSIFGEVAGGPPGNN